MKNEIDNTIQLLSEHSGISVSDLETYLKFIKAPPSFRNGQGAIRGIARLLSVPLVQDIDVTNLGEMMNINGHLARSLLSKPDLEIFNVSEKTPPRTAAHGMITNFPEYSVLFFWTPSNSIIIEQMKQLIFLANAGATYNDVSVYCRFIRILTENEVPQILVELFPKENPSASRIYEAIKFFIESDEMKNEIRNNSYTANLIENAIGALRFLKVLSGLNVIRRNHTGKTRIFEHRHSLGVRGFASVSNVAFVRYLTFVDEDEIFDTSYVKTFDSLDLSETELEELEAQGVEIAELENETQLVWFLDVLSPYYAQKFRAKIAREGQIARIQRQNQYLPCSIDVLNHVEMTHLVNFLESFTVTSRKDAAVILIIYIMLLTCSSFERAKHFTLFVGENNIIPDGIGFNLNSNQWVVPRMLLPFRTTEKPFQSALKPEKIIELPVHTHRVKELIELFFKTEKEHSKPLHKLAIGNSDISRFLKRIDERITPAKLANTLIAQLATYVSVSVAGYLFNRALPGSLARYYYSSHPAQEYQKTYDEVIQKVLPQNYVASRALTSSINDTAKLNYGFGARYVPPTEPIRETIQKLMTALSSNATSEKKYGFIDFHNLYTVTCIFLQSLLTGIRSVIDPFIGSNMLINGSELAVFRDKDTEDRFHTRILPLHPTAVGICDEYERHRNIVCEKMLLLNPNFCRSEILKRDTTFLIQPETFAVVAARPSKIKSILETFNDLPLNSNRKFLRSFLEKEGLIPEAIDATLGHASIGEPIGDSMSTFSFVDLKKQLFPALDRLIEELGITIPKGLS